jgi:hypothetical protein
MGFQTFYETVKIDNHSLNHQSSIENSQLFGDREKYQKNILPEKAKKQQLRN